MCPEPEAFGSEGWDSLSWRADSLYQTSCHAKRQRSQLLGKESAKGNPEL